MSPVMSFTESEIVEATKNQFTSLSLPFIIEDSLKLCIEKIRFIAEINKLQEKEILTNLLEWVNSQDSYHAEKLNPELKKRAKLKSIGCAIGFALLPLVAYALWWSPCKKEIESLKNNYDISNKISRLESMIITTWSIKRNGHDDDATLRRILERYETLCHRETYFWVGTIGSLVLSTFWTLASLSPSNPFDEEYQYHAAQHKKWSMIKNYLEVALKTERRKIAFSNTQKLFPSLESYWETSR